MSKYGAYSWEADEVSTSVCSIFILYATNVIEQAMLKFLMSPTNDETKTKVIRIIM